MPRNSAARGRSTCFMIILIVDFLSTYSCVMVVAAVPKILQTFDSNNHASGILLVSIYALGGIVGPLVHKPLSTKYGQLTIHHASMALFVAFNAVCAVVQNLDALLFFRCLAGYAIGGLVWNSPFMVKDIFTGEKRRTALAALYTARSLGMIVGPIAGALPENWRRIFYVSSLVVSLDSAFVWGSDANHRARVDA